MLKVMKDGSAYLTSQSICILLRTEQREIENGMTD